MTTITQAAPAVTRPASPVLVAARYLLQGYLWVALWYGAAVIVVGALVPLVISRFGAVAFSLVEVSWQAGVWFGFSMNASFGASYLAAHIGFGMTRRSYWQGVVLAALGFATVLAAFQTGLLALERRWFAAMGWGATDTGALVVASDGWAVTAGRYLLVYLAALIAGAVVTLTYHRFGAWVGTLTLPLTVGPMLIVGALVVAIGDTSPLEALGVAPDHVHLVGAAGALAVIALLVGALRMLVRGFRLTAPPR